MCDRTQIFHGVALFLKRIVRSGIAFHGNFRSLDLERLLCFGSRNQRSFYNESRADVDLADFRKIGHRIMINHLQRFKKCTVINDYKTEGLGITVRTNPSANGDFLIQIGIFVSKNITNAYQLFHFVPLFRKTDP